MSKVTMETRRGRESSRGTAENETLLTAQRSWRVKQEWKTGRKSRGAVKV